ncbi:MAG TPA: alpha/beta hydrolase [Nocardioides sp.]|uniref:alpha/beta fold hydrolase n=1 Tax=uncultured Nocardioides sp. TaxID=198441 RepID=UPI000EE4D2B8|nr:alpha/beta hydrolase [uncultured Nocardioides sp.]HCB05033.1 alpha/beta hydrolase [Nocardioides sp.]HRD62384.1 alpha/beta hydrolase [Nocardioides sp.]HRI97777.1 alpha/beta hydrolase [Nocardioides sp.]HRK46366.1 alpha/beta hydrolase [Nocardioides sp.]
MPTSAARIAPAPTIAYRDVLSDDGTRLRAWTNDPDGTIDGPTVLLCNGLGTGPWCWPALLRPDCQVRVVSWNHRGTGGSARPADPAHCGIEAFVEDALSVMDHFGIDQAPVMGWSMGVNTMFELVFRHPERVTGLFAVAGVPGDTFATMLAPFRLPRAIARGLTVSFARTLEVAGRVITPVTTRLPVGPKAIAVLTHSGFMFPVPDSEGAAHAVREFLTTPVDWFMHLAIATSEHGRVSLSKVGVPVAFVAARWDVLSGSRDMRSAAARIDAATYVELNGSHFVQMEQPDQVHALLLEFLDRVST